MNITTLHRYASATPFEWRCSDSEDLLRKEMATRMRLVYFAPGRVGVVDGDGLIHDVSPSVSGIDDWGGAAINRMVSEWETLESRLGAAAESAPPLSIMDQILYPPVPEPRHLIGIPSNYASHTAEMAAGPGRNLSGTLLERGFFLKSVSSLAGHGSNVELPSLEDRTYHHEVELAVVIGRRCRNVRPADALEYVFGYSCLLDITMRVTEQRREDRSTRKSFNTFTPMGPWIVTRDELPEPQNLSIKLWVNDQLKQVGNTADMLVSIAEQISYSSSVMTLLPGDVIATGTPSGVGPIAPGDRVRARIEGMGELEVRVTSGDTSFNGLA